MDRLIKQKHILKYISCITCAALILCSFIFLPVTEAFADDETFTCNVVVEWGSKVLYSGDVTFSGSFSNSRGIYQSFVSFESYSNVMRINTINSYFYGSSSTVNASASASILNDDTSKKVWIVIDSSYDLGRDSNSGGWVDITLKLDPNYVTPTPIPSNTPVPLATNTPVPNLDPTNTPVPLATNTPVPNLEPTNTPVPIITNSPEQFVSLSLINSSNPYVHLALGSYNYDFGPFPVPGSFYLGSYGLKITDFYQAYYNSHLYIDGSYRLYVDITDDGLNLDFRLVPLDGVTYSPNSTNSNLAVDHIDIVTPTPFVTNTPVPLATNTPAPNLNPTNTPVPLATNTPVPNLNPTNTPMPLYVEPSFDLPTFNGSGFGHFDYSDFGNNLDSLSDTLNTVSSSNGILGFVAFVNGFLEVLGPWKYIIIIPFFIIALGFVIGLF